MFGRSAAQAEEISRLQGRVRELEALVEVLAEQAGIHGADLETLRAKLEPGITDEVRTHVANGRMIEAIKEYRAATGAGLKEAKDAVEDYARRRG